jgi:quinol monooxygenase YgiN
MIIVNIVFNLKGKFQKEFMSEIIKKGIQRATQSESGNSRFDFMIPWGTKDKIFLLEYWSDESVLEHHKTLSHYFALQEIKSKYVETTSAERFVV